MIRGWIVGMLGVGLACAGSTRAMQPAPTPHTQAATAADQSSDARWDAYWHSHGVSPAPPRDFLEPPKPARPARWANLTRGAISDRVAARWILGMLRRGEGDAWAVRHLREDIVAADVLGSPGLSGDDQSIAQLRRAGVAAIEREQPSAELVAAAVVAVPIGYQLKYPSAELTEFAIVTLWRTTGASSVHVHDTGQREVVPARSPAGELDWQLDTGVFRDDPVVGALWYQARGWSCSPGTQLFNTICRVLLAEQ